MRMSRTSGGRSNRTHARRATCLPPMGLDTASRTRRDESGTDGRAVVRRRTAVDASGDSSTAMVARRRSVAADTPAVDALSGPLRPATAVACLRVHGLHRSGQYRELLLRPRERRADGRAAPCWLLLGLVSSRRARGDRLPG